MQWFRISLSFVLVFILGSESAVAGGASLVADYQFAATLESSVGAPPDLADLGPGDNVFQAESISGASRTVLAFPKGNGVQLTDATTVVAAGQYSIAVLFRFADIVGFRRLIDFKNGKIDCGIYMRDGLLTYHCPTLYAPTPVPANFWVQVVITRGIDGVVAGYIDGDLVFTVDDSTERAVIDADDTLRFFRDNDCAETCNEDSSGAVSRIRIWDDALTRAEVVAMEKCGDANASGTINATDALTALRAAVGATFCSLARCDVNLSGSLQASDALLILKIAVGSAAAPEICVIL